MNTQKVIIGVAAAIGIVYLLRKVMKANEAPQTQPGILDEGPITPEPQLRGAILGVPVLGSPGARTNVVWTDTTTRRCVGPDGKTIYVKGPCPSYR